MANNRRNFWFDPDPKAEYQEFSQQVKFTFGLPLACFPTGFLATKPKTFLPKILPYEALEFPPKFQRLSSIYESLSVGRDE